MTVALPIFLLICGLISLWLLVESKIAWWFKIASIACYCLFTATFLYSISSFLGWAALERDLPEKVGIHWVVVKEPSPIQRSRGRIYLLLEAYHGKHEHKFLTMFGYQSERREPRLYSLPYSRKLHEALEKSVIPRNKQGQIVEGTFKKKGDGEGREGDGKEGKGDGSESQEQEYMFYDLPPSEIQRK